MIKPYVPSSVKKLYDRLEKYGYRRPTQTDREIAPYIEAEKERVNWKKGLLEPIEAIFDLLQRGQYVTANVGQELRDFFEKRDKINIGKAVAEGITGQTKGDWTDVIDWDPQTKAGKVVRDVTGLGLNILLDPLTYVGFGASDDAVKAAKKVGEDVARIIPKELSKNPEMLQKLARTVDPADLKKVAQEGEEAVVKYLQEKGGGDVAKYINDTIKTARKRALREPADEIFEETQKRAKSILDEDTARIKDAFTDKAPTLGNMRSYYSQMEQVTNNPVADIVFDTSSRYAGAGTRSIRLFGKDYFVGERYPKYVQAWDAAGRYLAKTGPGKVLAKAVWSLTGPDSKIGKLKAAFGVRTPYEDMLNNIRRSTGRTLEYRVHTEVQAVDDIISPLNDESRRKVSDALMRSQQTTARAEGLDEVEIVAFDSIRALQKDWYRRMEYAKAKKVISDVGYIENYLPMKSKKQFYRRVGKVRGPTKPQFTKRRYDTFEGAIDREIEKVKWIWGVDDEAAEKIVRGGGAGLEVDLEKLLKTRAVAQAKLDNRVQLIEQFREFGIDKRNLIGDTGDPVVAFKKGNAAIDELGLRSIDDPGLEGYLFDRTTAGILERAAVFSSSDETLKGVGSAISNYTSWIKGWLTLSPGFHSRNMISNNITGFMNYGGDWLNPKTGFYASMGTFLGLNGRQATERHLKKLGVSDGKILQLFNTKFSGRTLEELANTAAERGVISRAIMGFDPELSEKAGSAVRKLNPFSTDFAGFKASHAVGNVIESTPRFQAFLIDVKRYGGKNMESAIDSAVLNAKKYFFDYNDLTPFEKKVMKRIIPFYSWLRKNIALQFETLVSKPDMYGLIPKVESSIRGDVDKEDMPSWMRELGYIPLNKQVQKLLGVENAAFWPNAPYQDLNKLPIKFQMTESGVPVPVMRSAKETLNEIVTNAHPALKSMLETIPADGYDLFYQTELGDTREAPGISQMLQKTPGILTAVDGVLRTLGHEGLQVEIRGNKLYMESKTAKLLEENIPFLKKIDQWLSLPRALFDPFEKTMEETFGLASGYDGIEQILQTLSFYGGVKFKQLDIEAEREREAENILREAEEEMYQARRQRPGYETRSKEYWDNRAERRKRLVGY